MDSLRSSALFLVVALASLSTGYAGIESWTGGGPDGGTVRSLVSDPSMPDRFFAGTVNGPYKSEDGGLTWTRAADGANATIRHLVVADDGVLYALDLGEVGDGGAVFKSTDGGSSWTVLSPPAGFLESVAVAPSDSSRLTLTYSVPDAVYLSTNGGATFALSETGLPIGKSGIAFHPTDAQIAYCATNEGVYRSTNGGVTWQPRNTNGVLRVSSIAVSRTNPDVLLAGYSSRILLSSNAGASWTENADVDAGFSVAIAPSNADHMMAVDNDGLSRSTDLGLTWNPIASFGPTAAASLAFNRSSPSTLLAGTFSLGVWRSTNGGSTWSDASSGMNASSLWHKSVRSTPDRAYNWNGLLKSTDAAATWSPIYGGLPENGFACSVDPTEVDHAACVGPFWLYETTDGGASWMNRTPAPFVINEFFELAIDPQNPQRWVLGNAGFMLSPTEMDATLAFSQNGGATWQTRLFADPAVWLYHYAYSVRFSPVNPDLIWVAGGGFRPASGNACWVQRSLDGGVTWQDFTEIGDSSCFVELRIDPVTPQNVYVLGTLSGDWEIYRSTDSGQTWSPLATPTTRPLAVAVNPINGELYVGDDALYRSSDGGATWSEFPTAGLPAEVRFVNYIDVSATNPPTLWISTNAGAFTYTGFGGDAIFLDGFESGDTSAWTAVVP